MKHKHMRAYGNGALDGYHTGMNVNPYDPAEQGEEHQAYELGYDYGVAMYCQDLDDDQYDIDEPPEVGSWLDVPLTGFGNTTGESK